MEDTYNILLKVLKIYDIKEISKKLDISISTINRWIESKNVPTLYQFDLMKFIYDDIDYSLFSSKDKDQFYTPVKTAQYCFDTFKNLMNKLNISIDDYYYIEPSAGTGSFIKVLPDIKTIGLDIEPKYNNIIKQDYLLWTPNDIKKKYIVFGNPPFGLRGSLALRFINHSYEFADFVCFILPQLFESDGKGVPRKRVKGYNLIYSEKIITNFYDPNNNEIKVNVIFQIWSKIIDNKDYILTNTTNNNIKIYSLSDGGSPSSTRNKKMLNICDIYLPSTCFGKENMRLYSSFEELPGKKGYSIVFKKDKKTMIEKCKKIDWRSVSFQSTNSAYNLRSSIIISQF